IFHLVAGIVMAVYPLVSHLENGPWSFFWGLAGLVPILWLAALDIGTRFNTVVWGQASFDENRRIFYAALFSSVFLSLVYFAVFYIRYRTGAEVEFTGPEQAAALIWTLSSHLLIFMGVFVLLCLVRAVSGFSSRPARMEFILCSLIAAALVSTILRNLVLSALSFGGLMATAYAIVAGIAIVALASGIGLRLQPQNQRVDSGLGLVLFPLTFGQITTNAGRALWAVVIAIAAYVVAISTSVMDWNFLIQKLTVILVWLASFGGFYAMTKEAAKERDRTVLMLIVAAASLVGYRQVEASRNRIASSLKQGSFDIAASLDRYEGYEVSFKVARGILTPRAGDVSFYAMLQQNTNIPRTTRVDPADVKLVENLTPSTIDKPNIFLFVIDSLRQDYLSPYNKQINFTPNIGAFASESIVMENAFTHYGATGLSEPSIWAGSMLLHKQYVTPFYPMNALQKLLRADGYQSYISMDTILSVVVEPSPNIVELDKGVPDKDFDFCRSLKDLQSKLDERQPDGAPVFAYSQPQNIHVSVINRDGARSIDGGSYPGFYAPYASRLKRMDECFGELIRFLKSRGLYDNSIVILTADHGDSLGEEGRWGHAYTLFPEVVRIPMIIHLPDRYKNQVRVDSKQIAFSTDITPSLYYLLGHRPIAVNPLFGRPLFTETREEHARYERNDYMLVSSYGAVYGILRGNGESLYISDGVNYMDYYYDLLDDPKGVRNRVSAGVKSESEELIRRHVEEINKFYRFSP
ncbi:MAG TPA: sulfatase-like hydrolase/transferase, partial [Blastocatellia bacterium]|nr:sulfatase-like hydrolase/transferase [Blastocatellia bacterium]